MGGGRQVGSHEAGEVAKGLHVAVARREMVKEEEER
jgi:hypothetical protein